VVRIGCIDGRVGAESDVIGVGVGGASLVGEPFRRPFCGGVVRGLRIAAH
jgi:hypothetical protein